MKRQYKWIAFVIAFILMLLLGVKITPLSERAIVAGLGIDCEGDVFTVSAQILLPSSDDSKTSGIVVSSAEGKTVAEAIAKISSESSMLVATSHCNLVLLGENVIQDKAYVALDYLVRNSYISENALLLTTEGKAKDILSAKTAYSETTSFYIQRELLVYGNYKEAVRRNIKEYLDSYYTYNSANWLTKVSKVETEKPQSTSSTSSSGSSGGGGEEDKVYFFDFAKCAIIKGNDYVFDGTEDIISGINFVNAKLEKGDIVVTSGNVSYCFYIIKSQGKLKYEPENYHCKAEIKLHLIMKEVISPEPIYFTVSDVEPPPEVDALVKEYVSNTVLSAFNECKSRDVDIFNLYGGFYGKMGKKWKDISEGYLEKSTMSTEVKLTYF